MDIKILISEIYGHLRNLSPDNSLLQLKVGLDRQLKIPGTVIQ